MPDTKQSADAMIMALCGGDVSKLQSLLAKAGIALPAKAPSVQPTERAPRTLKFKRPSPDYNLIHFTGCDRCLSIESNRRHMIWSEEQNCFKATKIVDGTHLEETKQSFSIVSSCSHCRSVFEKQGIDALIDLLMLDTHEQATRSAEFKKKLQKLTNTKGE